MTSTLVTYRKLRWPNWLRTTVWSAAIDNNTLAEAILDRLMQNAHCWALKGESMRKRLKEID
ncbi:ATP-binding protein [Pseudoalteromonas sp. GABNS16H]|uniref:ATP-binding protein n=1 Tax=Pseudoalteromonas sp. GABNS16H TaxID=3025325 RepID=UPI003FD0AC83